VSTLISPPAPPAPAQAAKPERPRRRTSSLFSAGEPQVWLTGGALVLSLVMIAGLLGLVLVKGGGTFWPVPVVGVTTSDGRTLWGEVAAEETYRPEEHALDVLPEDRRDAARRALAAAGGEDRRRMLRTANFELTGTHYTWVSDFQIVAEERPPWAVVFERLERGRFYGEPKAYLLGPPTRFEARPDGTRRATMPGADALAPVAEGPEAAWTKFEEHHEAVRDRWADAVRLKRDDLGAVLRREDEARLAVRRAELEIADEALQKRAVGAVGKRIAHEDWVTARAAAERDAAAARAAGREPGPFLEPEPPLPSADEDRALAGVRAEVEAIAAARRAERAVLRATEREKRDLQDKVDELEAENARHVLLVVTGDGKEQRLAVSDVVRAYPANRLGTGDRLGVYASRWGEFLGSEPRNSNSEGGVLPAIFGTVAMTLLMSLLVVPFGVLAALYLREYARQGRIVSLVRIAINNLAGVPSIVFGVFGLGFFCYVVGGSIDDLFFPERKPNPTFGTGGILWASLTLALLTLPVVIVATEEALAAVPRSMREGSYACGASKWQTIRRIVLPRAMPGIMTGMILAIARGAGEVAPLVLVGAVNKASALPVDGTFPYVHPERPFMHLGYHIYDVGFQSPNSEAAKPLVFTTTLLLITLIVLLNVVAIWVRSRLRRKFSAVQA
jgi:phosphate transport system permease protein